MLLFAVGIFAQPPEMHERHEKMMEKLEAHKVAFITDKVGLNPEEAKIFWPIYDEFEEKQKELRQSMRVDEDARDLSKEEAEKLVRDFVAKEQELAALKAEYFNKFLEILPPQKVIKLGKAEHQFRREMLRRVRERVQKHSEYNRSRQ